MTIFDAGGRRPATPLDRSRALVAAALASVGELGAMLTSAGCADTTPANTFNAALERASVDGDNLLRASRGGAGPRLLASLSRSGEGCRLHAAVLALDPAVVALSTDDASGPLDRFLAATGENIEAATRMLLERLAAAASALSVAAARLDLQSRFIDAILDEEGAYGEFAPLAVAQAGDLDAVAARELAFGAGAMLAERPLAIATGNRRALDTLFASMASGGKPA